MRVSTAFSLIDRMLAASAWAKPKALESMSRSLSLPYLRRLHLSLTLGLFPPGWNPERGAISACRLLEMGHERLHARGEIEGSCWHYASRPPCALDPQTP